ncbi:MAG: adventurous gliding motility lipoprotein CglB, partial [Myxococcaceae bacterium]|nr:adventurous gliding motility lipoprotein CglB [Myxococcaceae bacterium]
MRTALRAGVVFTVCAAATGCQVYDFEPVTPLAIAQTTQKNNVTAKKEKPNLMILLDKSGSMNEPLPGGTGCNNCRFPNCNEATCPTRMGAARRAMDDFLMNNSSVARMGLTVYPRGSVCEAATSAEVLVPVKPATDDPADLQTWANSINLQIQAPCNTNPGPTCPIGGTPTGGSLSFVGTIPEINDPNREDFVLLLTDGLPNCNMNNPNRCGAPGTADEASCRCTLLAGQCGMNITDQFCRLGCLDQDGAVEAVRELRSETAHAGGIKTIVVGFGSDFDPSNPNSAGFLVLNAMARAGGFQRTCPNGTNAECGTGGVCDMSSGQGICQTAFYSASNQTELIAA